MNNVKRVGAHQDEMKSDHERNYGELESFMSTRKNVSITDNERNILNHRLSGVIGIDFRGLKKISLNTYCLCTPPYPFVLGNVACITNQTRFRNKIVAIKNRPMPRYSSKQWRIIVQAMLATCEQGWDEGGDTR